jgi:hypothetical protein
MPVRLIAACRREIVVFIAQDRTIGSKPALPVPRPGRDREARSDCSKLLPLSYMKIAAMTITPCIPRSGPGFQDVLVEDMVVMVDLQRYRCFVT